MSTEEDKDEELRCATEKELNLKRYQRDSLAFQKFLNSVDPNLPIDSDVVQTRPPMQKVGDVASSILKLFNLDSDPFYDLVCEKWESLFPNLKLRVGRYEKGILVLYVSSSPIMFMMRSKIPMIRKTLLKLPNAPEKLSVHLEVHK